MSNKYNPAEIEPKWQQIWEEQQLYRVTADPDRPKWYALTMLPYPSGDLHTGHWYAYTPSDAAARFRRMNGYNVFFPIGFDAFGLPAENAAIKHGVHPAQWTYANIERMRGQLRRMGAMWAWEHEAVSCDPEYYKWSQWFFRKFYDAGLAYREYAPVDFCPTCNTTLAREQVWGDDRHCERCGTPVIKKNLEQWKFRITNYADELIDMLEQIEWPERVKVMQTNWIGRSVGAEVTFHTEQGDPLVIFTTRPDTLWGATFMVLAPEHPLVDAVTTDAQRAEVEAYQAQAARMDEIQRGAADKEKTGVFTGGYAINPVNGERIPIWIADYVMMGYGTGAIMAVPAHDSRDFAFAQKYGLEIRRVITGPDGATGPLTEAYDSKDTGEMINSGPFDGTPVKGAVAKVVEWLEANELGRGAVNYRLRDWLISRQRMWGAPIPMIYCPNCGIVPVPYEDLPVLLPDDAEFRPTGESPLKYHEGFRHVKCPECGGDAERETDTMDTFMCSSWYQYAYISPYWKRGEALKADDIPWDKAAGDYWLPVDQYTGGIEHATMHLLYTRFFTKALRDLGIVDFDEPMLRLFNQGMILGPDGEKMSKSRGNVINPDEVVNRYGADTVRGYLMFIGPWDQGGPWDPQAIEGVHRFLHRVWAVVTEDAQLEQPLLEADRAPDPAQERALERKLHQTILKVTDDIQNFRFNTAIAALMELNNYLYRVRESTVVNSAIWNQALRDLMLMMAPIFPHIADELWHRQGNTSSVHKQRWPVGDPEKAREEEITVVVQINGKVRDKLMVAPGTPAAELEAAALQLSNVVKWLEGRAPRKVIVVPDKLVNIVAG
ncbi:MAG TPA: leucine--tRNA ligase [Chloroflexi bacterium]|nr:leucine--tRNA ligase [Chloroflexota bacterium]HHW87491.1 leucine--tRNA ligase [Chloroflexota bacterium]